MIEIDKLFAEIKQAEDKRAEQMPTEQDAIRMLHSAYLRLKELGWKEGVYAPEDGSYFSAIEIESKGIHKCAYLNASWCTFDGDVWPSSTPPLMFRERKDTDNDVNLGPCTMGLESENNE